MWPPTTVCAVPLAGHQLGCIEGVLLAQESQPDTRGLACLGDVVRRHPSDTCGPAFRSSQTDS